MITRLPGVLSLLGLSFSLFACGGAAKPAATAEGETSVAPAAAPAPDEAPAMDRDARKAQLEADLSRAEDELAAAMPPSGAPNKKTESQDRAMSRPADTAVSPAQQPATPMAGGAGTGPAPGAGTTCEGVCRAYASMQNAAGKLCELAGQDDERCTAAKGRLGRAQDRLKASCPMCEASSK